jgi:hypothetical protein
MLTVADHAGDRDAEGGQVGRDLAQQAGEVVTGRRQQGASQQDQPGQAIADDPQHFVANIGLKIARMTRPWPTSVSRCAAVPAEAATSSS